MGEARNRAKRDRTARLTYIGDTKLFSRQKEHFLNENKDRSIFRKNIGRALLNRAHDSFLEQWNLDLTIKKEREKCKDRIDVNRQKQVEQQITEYIQGNFSFVVLQIDERQKRLYVESKIISTVSLCDECSPSRNWLGLHSPIPKIRESGLWLVQGLYKQPLTKSEFTRLEALIKLM